LLDLKLFWLIILHNSGKLERINGNAWCKFVSWKNIRFTSKYERLLINSAFPFSHQSSPFTVCLHWNLWCRNSRKSSLPRNSYKLLLCTNYFALIFNAKRNTNSPHPYCLGPGAHGVIFILRNFIQFSLSQGIRLYIWVGATVQMCESLKGSSYIL
jgi:hypothetical protein